MTAKPYLTPAEVAGELGMSADGVRKLVRRGKLKAIRRSERQILISRAALEAYRRRINGESPARFELPEIGDPTELRAQFAMATGQTPKAWLEAWKKDEIVDSAANMALMVHASALRAHELRGRQDGRPGGRPPKQASSEQASRSAKKRSRPATRTAA